MYVQHKFQREWTKKMLEESGGKRVVNFACKEDPAKLYHMFNAVNIDIRDEDEETKTALRDVVGNFIQCDIRNTPFFDDVFDVAVLGEILEHCTFEAAAEVVQEANRLACFAVVTVPFDTRAPHEQHDEEALYEVAPGCYTYHVTNWKDDLAPLFEANGWEILHVEKLDYDGLFEGEGVVLRRKE